jgi:tetratricopeptide (TPR) repeat protein
VAPLVRGLTLLDHALIDAAVASASEQHGALLPEQVRDLVEEVVDLNTKRTQSRFVLGFLDVLQGREPAPGGPEANAERRGWYLAGALSGLARRGDHAAVVGLARSQPEIVRSLLQPDAPALELVAGLLFDSHAAAGSLGELLRLLGVPAVLAAWDSLAERMLREATRLLRIYRPDEAFSLLMLLYGAVERWDRPDPPPDKFRADLDRRRAHALRLRGDMEGARKILNELLRRGAGVHASRAYADLGLIASGHSALAHVEVPRDAAEWGGKAKALRRGLEHFEASVLEPEPGGAHGDYCLGVLHLCEGAYAKARPHLERAVAEMQSNEGVYAPLGTLARARLYLGVCLADSMDLARAGHAVELLAQGVKALGTGVPMPLLLHAFEALGTTDPARVAALVDDLRGPLGDRLLEAVRAADRLHEHPELLERLVARMGDAGRPRRERIHDAEIVLAAALKAGAPQTGAEALDVLEHLADDREQRQRLLALLESRERYDPAWSHAEALMARASLLEADARYAEAQALLEEVAHEQLGQEGERAVPFASAIVERIREHGRGAASEALQRRVAALAPAPPPRPAGARPAIPRGRVLFLGGDERQKQYDERLVAELRAAYPEVELDIEHTGWSSNWGRWLDGIQARIRVADAVVLMQFMRTLFGRRVREACGRFDKPWFPCTGHGFASMKRSIEQAIQRLPAAT